MFFGFFNYMLNVSFLFIRYRIMFVVYFFLGVRCFGIIFLIVYLEFEYYIGMLNIIFIVSLLSRRIVYFFDKFRYFKVFI